MNMYFNHLQKTVEFQGRTSKATTVTLVFVHLLFAWYPWAVLSLEWGFGSRCAS